MFTNKLSKLKEKFIKTYIELYNHNPEVIIYEFEDKKFIIFQYENKLSEGTKFKYILTLNEHNFVTSLISYVERVAISDDGLTRLIDNLPFDNNEFDKNLAWLYAHNLYVIIDKLF